MNKSLSVKTNASNHVFGYSDQMASLFAQSQRHYSVTACETTCVLELLLVPKDSLVRKTTQTNDLYKDIRR